MSRQHFVIVFDGGCIGNPGRGYGSYAIDAGGGAPMVRRLDFDGRTTNNEAEYDTLIAALSYLTESLQMQGVSPSSVTVDVRGDSQLVINQVTGRWKARNPRMAERRDRVLELVKRFKNVTFRQHPRSESVRWLGH